MFTKVMGLKSAQIRELLDVRDYKNPIESAHKKYYPDARLEFEQDRYSVKTRKEIKNGHARLIGSVIARSCAIGLHVKGYDYSGNRHSNQLFIEIKGKN